MSREWPKYRSHKVVQALEIDAIRGIAEAGDGDKIVLSFRDAGHAPQAVDRSLFVRFNPNPGDFLVKYDDGYTSLSPRKAFVEGYAWIDESELQSGKSVSLPSEQSIERVLQAKGKTAPRVTPEQIDATIAGQAYLQPDGTTLTICILMLRNGFTVTGESAAASPENFDKEIGRTIAMTNARAKIWALEGYLLRQRLFEQTAKIGDYQESQA